MVPLSVSKHSDPIVKYDSDSIIRIMQDIDKLIDERREMIETIADLQTRAAAHTQERQPGPGNQPVIEKGFCDNSGCNNWPECNYQKGQNPPCTSLLSELCAALGWQGGTRADAIARVKELNGIANRCAQDVNYHATPKPREFTERGGTIR